MLFFVALQKAKGDVKKKGKADPYAYLPLDIKTLNRRYVMKVVYIMPFEEIEVLLM